MSSEFATPNMVPVMEPAAQSFTEHGRFGRLTSAVAIGMLSAVSVFCVAGEASAQDSSSNNSVDVSASATATAPNFSLVGACNYPGEFGSHDATDKLAAKKCIQFGMMGPDDKGADVVIIDLTDAPMSKLKKTEKELEKLALIETKGALKLDVTIVQPPEAAQTAVDEFLSTGCVDPIEAAGNETPLVVDIAMEHMPELNAVPHVIAASDAYTCEDILGYSNTKSRIDVFNARLSEVSAKLLARVGLHEILHNLGLGHMQTASNVALTSATTPIESKYFTDGVFDYENFLKEEVTYGAVLNGGDTLMASINPAIKRQPLDGFQLSRLDWARRVLKIPGAYKASVLQENKPYSFNIKSKRPQVAVAPLGSYKSVYDYKLDKEGQMNKLEEQGIVWDSLTFVPVYSKNNKSVKGVRVALGYTNDASEAVMGMFKRDKSQKLTVVRIPLPTNKLVHGDVNRTAIITMGKKKISTVIESVPIS